MRNPRPDPIETALGSAGAILGLIGVLQSSDEPLLTTVSLGLISIALLALWLHRRLRAARLIFHNREILSRLVRLINSAQTSIWTVRSHLGEGEDEEPYFRHLAARVLEDELDDVRRLIRIGGSEGVRRHLKWLVDTLANRPEVKVRYTFDLGPQFDFAVFDGRHGVLGFPQTSSEGFAGAVFFDDKRAASSLSAAFTNLWIEATPLFSGRPSITEEERQALKEHVDSLFEHNNPNESGHN